MPARIRLRHVVEHIAVVSALSCSINLAKRPEKQNRDEIENHFKKSLREIQVDAFQIWATRVKFGGSVCSLSHTRPSGPCSTQWRILSAKRLAQKRKKYMASSRTIDPAQIAGSKLAFWPSIVHIDRSIAATEAHRATVNAFPAWPADRAARPKLGRSDNKTGRSSVTRRLLPFA